jgi:hypothetical protein
MERYCLTEDEIRVKALYVLSGAPAIGFFAEPAAGAAADRMQRVRRYLLFAASVLTYLRSSSLH